MCYIMWYIFKALHKYYITAVSFGSFNRQRNNMNLETYLKVFATYGSIHYF